MMYLLVSEGVLPHTPSMYRRRPSWLAQAHREGGFPDLVDTLREVHVRGFGASVRDLPHRDAQLVRGALPARETGTRGLLPDSCSSKGV
ncbi:hypothetical protein OG819_55600 [Streptomyces sp. NBC_01549]|uniref:hypothetical protein n=1 Tax=Streptomyces sp. NBC_01549 TaxID=2975874 RepID=UPI00225B1F28|nr:hypothetical protein [Streptomyces sp. NBC_01549]MCX4598383.1 hypothetical protein [Streptomyces sp. NBC_01549]